MFHPIQRLGLLRERGAGWGRVRSGFPFGRGNSEGRTPSPKEPAASFILLSTPSLDANGTCIIYGRGSWLSCMNSRPTGPPRRAEFLPSTTSPLFSSAPTTTRGSCHNDPFLRAITVQPSHTATPLNDLYELSYVILVFF